MPDRNGIDRVRERVRGPEYAFLRERPELRGCIYLTLSGSWGYGTHVAGSDIDLRGVLVEPRRNLLGLEPFEQYEDAGTDTVIWGLRKYVLLCVAANPTALELLGVDEDCVVLQTPAGRLLRESAGLFLTRRVIGSFGGYAAAQLRRLCNALCHDRYSEAEQEAHLAAALDGQIEHFNRTYTAFGEHALRIYQDDGNTLRLDASLSGYPLRDFVGIYGEMHNTVKTYNKLNHRGRKKDEAHLRKHAMHLVRLLMTGADILEGRGIRTRRTAEHGLLMDIREGRYTFDEIKALAEDYQERFRRAAERTELPREPDMRQVERLMLELHAAAAQ